ncbi:MAG: hypothetical protein J6V00_05330 [Bacteroidaceae bacterium]|nr:hypothetical protein [Bacteroidaceae bacterium]
MTRRVLQLGRFENKGKLSLYDLINKQNRLTIFTVVDNYKDGWEVILFLRSFGYEGVQNDSLRYCNLNLEYSLKQVGEACIGICGGRMVIHKYKRRLKGKGYIYYEKPRVFAQRVKEHFQDTN